MAKAEPTIQPRNTPAPPPAEKPDWKEVMPPARMQMMENEIAKLEKPPMRLASSCA